MNAHRAQVVVVLEGGYGLRVRVEDCEASLERMLPVLAHLMRAAIRHDQPQSAAISRTQTHSDAISHNQPPDEGRNQTPSERPSENGSPLSDGTMLSVPLYTIASSISQSVALSGNQWPSLAIIGYHWQSLAISGNQWQSITIHHNQSSSGAPLLP